MSNPLSAQGGAVLVMSLLMLVVITLLAVSSINSGTVNLRIVDNMRVQQDAEAAAQQAIEGVLSEETNFDAAPSAETVTVNAWTVDTPAPKCLRAMPAKGYSAVWKLAPEDTVWEVRAKVSDATTGARIDLHQGATLRLVSGSCL